MAQNRIEDYWMVPSQFIKRENHGLKDFLENYCGYKIMDDNSIRKNGVTIGTFSEDSDTIIEYDLDSPGQIEEAGRLKRILEMNNQRHIEKPSIEELIQMKIIKPLEEKTIFIEK